MSGHVASSRVTRDPYAPYVLKRWQDGERNGTHIFQEIVAQGYPGSSRMVYRDLENPQNNRGETHCGNTASVPLHLNLRRVPLHAASRQLR